MYLTHRQPYNSYSVRQMLYTQVLAGNSFSIALLTLRETLERNKKNTQQLEASTLSVSATHNTMNRSTQVLDEEIWSTSHDMGDMPTCERIGTHYARARSLCKSYGEY